MIFDRFYTTHSSCIQDQCLLLINVDQFWSKLLYWSYYWSNIDISSDNGPWSTSTTPHSPFIYMVICLQPIFGSIPEFWYDIDQHWGSIQCAPKYKLHALLPIQYSELKGGVHIRGEICPRSDPDIAHMRYYLGPLKLKYK